MLPLIEIEFLRESNNVEDEWDDKALEDAIVAWQHVKKQKKLTKQVVLDTHSILMRRRDTLLPEQKGRFRDGPVWVGRREGKPWFVVPELIEQWLERVNREADRYESIGEEKEFYTRDAHIAYEHIHPFFDGNGRTGRIFYNWQRLKLGLPIHVIHVGQEQYDYYKWFDKQK